jgi:NitT/TauT family transport system ATP-binding protein
MEKNMKATAIEVKNVSMAFSSVECPELSDVNLTVESGKITSIVGPSGCGKSTLLRLIAGVLIPNSGKIVVDNPDGISGWTNLSFVPQDSLLLPWRTV